MRVLWRVSTLRELLNNLPVKGGDIGGLATCYQTVVSYHLLVGPLATGIPNIGSY